MKDYGDVWILGQAPIHSNTAFKFVIEGLVGKGLEGDIGLDDLFLFDGNCQLITKQESTDCDFSRENMCSWSGHRDWRVHKDKYLYLNGGKEVTRALVSPPLQATEVKCIRFWFKSEGKYFKRSLKLFINSSDSNSSSMIWSVDEEIQKWTFFPTPIGKRGQRVPGCFRGIKATTPTNYKHR